MKRIFNELLLELTKFHLSQLNPNCPYPLMRKVVLRVHKLESTLRPIKRAHT